MNLAVAAGVSTVIKFSFHILGVAGSNPGEVSNILFEQDPLADEL